MSKGNRMPPDTLSVPRHAHFPAKYTLEPCRSRPRLDATMADAFGTDILSFLMTHFFCAGTEHFGYSM
jgi:hypothetical protein